jgi:hypothetical protein
LGLREEASLEECAGQDSAHVTNNPTVSHGAFWSEEHRIEQGYFILSEKRVFDLTKP